ncbi:MAG: FAD-binding protein [Chloroflexi bacterium]|nr:FAD-binding protein [Chloroflexota bacterium]
MNIVVCVKQTPVSSDLRFDEATKTLIREGVTLSMSSLDRRAVLEALRLRNEVGGTVTILTMGPPQAHSVLVEALGLGADKAVLLSDPAFAGSDTLATSRALAAAVKRLDADLVVCGKFTIDSETSQVPSELAEFLGRPQVTAVRQIRPTGDKTLLWVERETDDGFEQYELRLPALVSVTELITTFRRSSPEELEEGGKKPIETWSAKDVGIDPTTVGFAGSPTRVAELRSAKLERAGTVIAGETSEAAADLLANYLLERGVFGGRERQSIVGPRRQTPASLDASKAIWVVAELSNGDLRPVTLEILGKAQELADHWGGEVAAVLVGGPDSARHVVTLGAYGADTVYTAISDGLTAFDVLPYTHLLATAITRYKPHAVLLASTTDGRDWAPRVAARLQIGLTGDCVDLELSPDGELAQIKPAFGGNIVAPIFSSTTPAMATVRPGMLEARVPRSDVTPRVVRLDLPMAAEGTKRVGTRQLEQGMGGTALDSTPAVVAVGLGIGGPENLPVVRELADALGGAIAGSLRVASNGWIPAQLQIGLTGKAVAPRFYIAVGVSGQANHVFGIRRAEHIIAINNDPEAPIFKTADIGVVGDWAEVVPALTRALLAAKRRGAD